MLRAISLISKGILARSKAISLATKGILDSLVRKGAQRKIDFVYVYVLSGIKKKETKYTILIEAIKSLELLKLLRVESLKQLELIDKYLIRGTLKYSIAKPLTLKTKVTRPLEHYNRLIGSKLTKSEENFNLLGIKQKDTDFRTKLIATKSTSFIESSMLKGRKKSNIEHKTSINGKRDNTVLLEVLDLLEQEVE
jgi:hypothetical protein